MSIRKVLPIALAALGVLYPLLVYVGGERISFRVIALVLGMSFLGGFVLQDKQQRNIRLVLPILVAILFCAVSAWSNHPRLVLYLPFVFSLSFLCSFGYTLFSPPSLIEIFARMIHPDRSPEEIAYCRRVTLLWVCFFLGNGSVAFYTACCASLATWSMYNGLISYGVIGVLFAAELSYRSWRFRRYAGLPTDALFKRVFPPKGSA